MLKRNAHGAGSIRLRRNGLWEARYTVGRDGGTGKQKQKSLYGKTQKEVLKKLQQINLDIENGTYIEPSKLTVKQWINIWLDNYTSNLKPLSYAAYLSVCNTHIIPCIGALKLISLSTHTIQKFYNSLYQEKNLSAKTVTKIHGILHKSLQQAVNLHYINHNPSDFCTLPKVKKKDIKPLTTDQIKEFIKCIENEQYKDLYIVTLFTGMRQSEVLGLAWNDIDFSKGVIKVTEQLQKERKKGGDYYRATLKNDKIRIICPAPYVIQILKKVQAKQKKARLKAGALWGGNNSVNDNLVFTNDLGEHLHHITVYKHYKRIVSKLGLTDLRFHDLRHSYAVTALQNGDDVKTVQENLGHQTAAFTLDVYGHVTEQMKKESAERMEKFIKNL